MRLEIGNIIKTNYGTGPYEIISIIRGCTCSSYLDMINKKDPPKSTEHIHLTVRQVLKDGSLSVSKFYLNGYDEETLKSVLGDDDEIILCESTKPVQATFF